MTPTERAEKIGRMFVAYISGYKGLIEQVQSQIEEAINQRIFATCPKHSIEPEIFGCPVCKCEEAEREAVRKAVIGSFSKEYDAKYAEGFNAAREKAKGIAKELEWKAHGDDDCLAIAQRISELTPQSGEPSTERRMEP